MEHHGITHLGKRTLEAEIVRWAPHATLLREQRGVADRQYTHHRACNIYFAVLVFLQLYPAVATIPVSSTLVPLILVLSITAVKDGYDDYKRHVMDRKLNEKTEPTLNAQGEWVDVAWRTWRSARLPRCCRTSPSPRTWCSSPPAKSLGNATSPPT